MEEINYKFVPELNGIFEIKITFNIVLKSLSELFKNCKNLIEVDLSNLECSNLDNLNSTFEGCDSLEYANLTLKNGSNIQSMDNLFSGCTNLIDIDLSNFQPQFNISLQYMFKNCIKLNFADLSNFNTFNYQGIFSGCINIKIYNDQTIESSISNKPINEIINSIKDSLSLNCKIGENEKCKTCQQGLISSLYCEKCNEGYYIPYQKKRKECLKCNDNCLNCFGSVTFQYCYKCKEEFYSNDGICLKKCEIGNNTNCNSCNSTLQHLCETCNEGYFLPSDNKTECKKCDIENCIICSGNSTYKQCDLCDIDYYYSGNKCLKKCEVGNNEKCITCNIEEGKINECLECNPGFYLPKENKTQCKKCSLENCEICNNDICTKCFDNFLTKFEAEDIISCYNDIPERIDIIKSGNLTEGIIETMSSHVKKTQLSDSIKYSIEEACSVPSTSYWWKTITGKCYLDLYFNISDILPKKYLEGDYIYYIKGTQKFEASGGSAREYQANNFYYSVCVPPWDNFCSHFFGVYKNLEKVPQNGKIHNGGIYSRGYNDLQLEGFNVSKLAQNGTQTIGFYFNMAVGQFSSGTISTKITFIINELYMIRKNK